MRHFDLASPASTTIAYKHDLEYQNAEIAVDASGLTSLGSANGEHTMFRELLAGGTRLSLYTAGGEYLSELATDEAHAYFFATHFKLGTHDGVGRVALDGSSAGAIEWLTKPDDHNTLTATGAQGGILPITADSVIVAVIAAGETDVTLKRIDKKTGAECVLGTFPTAAGPAITYAAGAHSFAWYGFDEKLHWYVLS